MTNPDAPRVTEWAEDDRGIHRRSIGVARLVVERITGWTWAVSFVAGDGRLHHVATAANYAPFADSAKAACEAAARRAGIAVPRG